MQQQSCATATYWFSGTWKHLLQVRNDQADGFLVRQVLHFLGKPSSSHVDEDRIAGGFVQVQEVPTGFRLSYNDVLSA
jgi:hypothetical protein